jgi:hypothetical protein
MKIRRIDLDDDGDPSSVTVELSLAEAILITRTVGKGNGHDSNLLMEGGDLIAAQTYLCLTGDLFNRYWDDGIDGAAPKPTGQHQTDHAFVPKDVCARCSLPHKPYHDGPVLIRSPFGTEMEGR